MFPFESPLVFQKIQEIPVFFRQEIMDASKEVLSLAHHRSRKRIRDLGEVFTPEKYVHEMLDMLEKRVWSDTNVVFFEPTCGHGNFVIAIIQRRLHAFLKKAKKLKSKKPHFYATANTLNNLWAIDVDSKNIDFCRSRVWEVIFGFLLENEKGKVSPSVLIKKNKDFFAHILCCIKWQIHENEALSCLEDNPVKAEKSANKTMVSKKWFKKNKHKPIDFELSWSEYFILLKRSKSIPIEYKRSLKFLDSLEKFSKKRAFKGFNFVNIEFDEKTYRKVV